MQSAGNDEGCFGSTVGETHRSTSGNQSNLKRIIDTFKAWRTDKKDRVYNEAFYRATALNAIAEDNAEILIPMLRLDGLQRNRNNAPAETSNEYYQSAVRYLLLDSMLSELYFRFSEHTKI